MRGHHTVLVGRALDIPPCPPRHIQVLSPSKDTREGGKTSMDSGGYEKLISRVGRAGG